MVSDLVTQTFYLFYYIKVKNLWFCAKIVRCTNTNFVFQLGHFESVFRFSVNIVPDKTETIWLWIRKKIFLKSKDIWKGSLNRLYITPVCLKSKIFHHLESLLLKLEITSWKTLLSKTNIAVNSCGITLDQSRAGLLNIKFFNPVP